MKFLESGPLNLLSNTITKMFGLALAGVTGFSIAPLILTVYLAVIGSVTSLLLILYVLWLKFFYNEQLKPGWAFLSIGSLLMSSFALTSLATIALYLCRLENLLSNSNW